MLDERWLATLGRLRLVSRLAPEMNRAAWRPVRRSGEGIDFLSHREYMPGDDFRSIDWKALARLDRPYVKVYAREEQLPMELAIDTSASMGQPDGRKFAFARGLAACLGYVALASGERLRLVPSREPGAGGDGYALTYAGRTAQALSRMLRALDALVPEGAMHLPEWAQRLTQARRGPALTILISDLLTPPDQVEQALQLLGRARREAVLLHVLSAGELLPDTLGELRLVDVESGDSIFVRADPATISRYLEALERWVAELSAMAARHRFRYVTLSSGASPYEAVTRELRQAGVVR